jgi:hypothetical protein
MLVALLCAAALQNGLMAALELKDKLKGEDVIHPWGNQPPSGRLANFCDVSCKRALGEKADADVSQNDGWATTAAVGFRCVQP